MKYKNITRIDSEYITVDIILNAEIIDADNDRIVFYKNGEIHCDNGPAIISSDGSQFWYRNGKLHREDGPAIIHVNGERSWYKNGVYHREDGPAIIWSNGSQEWWVNGILHRQDGPMIWADDKQYGYKDGEKV